MAINGLTLEDSGSEANKTTPRKRSRSPPTSSAFSESDIEAAELLMELSNSTSAAVERDESTGGSINNMNKSTAAEAEDEEEEMLSRRWKKRRRRSLDSIYKATVPIAVS